MSWTLFVWLAVLILQAGLLGKSIYSLMSLADLEQDFINPYDLCARLNKFVWLELAAQVLSLVLVLAAQLWFATILQAVLTGYLFFQHTKGKTRVDPTDIFKQLKPQQRWRMVLFGGYCVSFVFTIYRLIETIVHSALTPEGREVAKRLFREAAASLPGY